MRVLVPMNPGSPSRCDSEGEALATNISRWELARPVPIVGADPERWYALHTRSRHEKAVAQRLAELGVECYLPMVTEVHRWSDRKKTVQLPLFGCYVFARFAPQQPDRLDLRRVDGVLGIVGNRGEGSPIPDEQIDAIRMVLDRSLKWASHPFLKMGQRVRIRGGALDGMEGILVSRSGNHSLVISVDALQRSLSVRVEGYQVEPI